MNTDSSALIVFVRSFASVITFLFTNSIGILILLCFALFLFAFKVKKSFIVYKTQMKVLGKKTSLFSIFSIVIEELYSILLSAFAILPQLAMTAFILILLFGLNDTFTVLDTFAKNQAKIKELTKVVKNLDKRYRALTVTCLDDSYDTLNLNIAYYDDTGSKIVKAQGITLSGKEVFIDLIVFNFAYSEIEKGSEINLAIPYRIFSDTIAQEDGIELAFFDSNGVPYIYERTDNNLIGIGKKEYDDRLLELMKILKDNKLSKQEGILRSVYGNAIHRIMKKGDEFTIWIEETGGLSVKDKVVF